MRIALLVPALSLCLAAQTPTALDAPITRVRLHPDEAWVTRVGEVRITSAGTAKLVVKDLPGGLSLDDLRVSAKLGSVFVTKRRILLRHDPLRCSLKQSELRHAIHQRRHNLSGPFGFVAHHLCSPLKIVIRFHHRA